MTTRHEVRPFTADELDDASDLLAERHRSHRQAWPALDPRFEDPAATRALIATILHREGASGSVVLAEGRPVAYILGAPKDASWGPNIWVDDAGSAGADPEAIRVAYAHAASRWADEGLTRHYVVTPAADSAIVHAWFSMSFGLQHIHALRELPAPDFTVRAASGLIVRPTEPRDIDALVEMDPVLPSHSQRSPVFATVPVSTPDVARREIEEELRDDRFAPFVAEYEERIVGAATFCPLEVSNGNTLMMRPVSAGFLGYAVASPGARGLGVGRALGDACLVWTRDNGYDWVATDWRSTNIEANRTWRAAGFRPTFYRLFRAID